MTGQNKSQPMWWSAGMWNPIDDPAVIAMRNHLSQQAQGQAQTQFSQQSGLMQQAYPGGVTQALQGINSIPAYTLSLMGMAQQYAAPPRLRSDFELAIEEVDKLYPGFTERLERYVEPLWLRFLRWLSKHL